MASNRLEAAAIATRSTLIAINNYDNVDQSNNYTATHTRALSDATTPVNGKGTGVFLDTYNGGGSLDVYGTAQWAGSGRIAAIANNGSTWGYTPSTYYTAPDTSLNQGQVAF